MSVLKFATNVPVEVALAYSDGKEVEGNYGPQMMFSLAAAPNGEKTMYVPPIVAQRFQELHVGKGQRIIICKAEAKNGQRHGIAWQVSRIDPDPQWQKPTGEPAATRPEPAPTPAKVNGAAQVQGGGSNTTHDQPTKPANGNGNGSVNGHAAVNGIPPLKVQFGDAMQEFLVAAGRGSRQAELVLGAEGGSVRFDSRDIAAMAACMFIAADRHGSLIWTPGGAR
jgi:hypothetical protein